MSTLHKVREHLEESHRAHRQTHEDALRAAAVARAEQDAARAVNVPTVGLQADEGDFWEIEGGE